MKWNKHLSKEKCIVMKTGIGIVSNKNGACENELIRNSLLPLPCLTAFSVSFLLLLGWNPAEQRAGKAETAVAFWRCGKAQILAHSRGVAGSPSPGWWLCLQGSNTAVPEGSLCPTHRDCCAVTVRLTWEILALILVLIVVKTWILLKN